MNEETPSKNATRNILKQLTT